MKSSDKLITDLSILGEGVKYLAGEVSEIPKEFTESEMDEMKDLISGVHVFNPWFTPEMVEKSLKGIALMLDKDSLQNWLADYALPVSNPKKIAVIMAGNIPMVGFHDFLSVLMSGNKVLIKMSSDDNKLLPALISLLFKLDESYKEEIQFSIQELKDFDAVIATGSDNTSRYFKEYFGSYPNIIRKNRTSVAIIEDGTSDEELKLLANDIFDYFGLGCRNVSKFFIPRDFDLDRFFKAIFHKGEVINHNKYANNYDYNRAIYLMNQEDILDNGFLLLKEADDLFSPLGMLFYQRYDDLKEVENALDANKDQIQAVIGKGQIPFGEGQKPGLKDYADGVDVMKFLESLA